MRRRSFFATLLAPLVAPFLPKVAARHGNRFIDCRIANQMAEINAYTLKYIQPRLLDTVFQKSPLFYRLNKTL